MRRRVFHWAVVYYASTAVFVALDVLLAANLRAVAFESYPGLRGLYYAVLLACGVLAHARPRWSAPITLVESSFSLTTMALAVLAPHYVYALELRAAPGPDPAALTFNFLLCGSAAVLAFHGAMSSISGSASKRRLEPSA
jgi:hypothetical protein